MLRSWDKAWSLEGLGGKKNMRKHEVQESFGQAVKRLRNRLGISQEELAGRAGLHRTYVSDVERGSRNISLASIEKLAGALETSLAHLFAQAGGVPAGTGGNRPVPGSNGLVDVLLIEDDPRDVEMTLAAFRRARLTNRIQAVRDGAAAMELLFGGGRPAGHRRQKALPGLILLDLNLPKIDGIEVLRRVKADERTRGIPVVVLTVSQHSRDIIECQTLGADAYLVKPVEFQNFSRLTPKLSLHWALLKPGIAASP